MTFAAQAFDYIVCAFADSGAMRIPVGGQAVIEGVLMKGPRHSGLAVREPSGKIFLKFWRGSEWLTKGIWKYPIVRGFATMVEMMRIGMRALSLSADISLGDEEKISPLESAVSVAAALLGVVAIFVALPMFVSEFLIARLDMPHFLKNVSEGIFREIIFVGYVALISLWKDIARVFEYHGAEHKTINAYESGAELSPGSVARYSRIHRRCGTSFLIIVVLVSIVVFSAVGDGKVAWRIGSRVVLLPIVIGVAYEFIKAAANSAKCGLRLMKPALMLQYITTKEPSSDQLEVAIAALEVALGPTKENIASGGAQYGTYR